MSAQTMHSDLYYWGSLFFLLVLASLASFKFYTWPPVTKSKNHLRLRHVLGACCIFFLGGALPFFSGSYDNTVRSFLGLFLFSAFLFYLLLLPRQVSLDVVAAGEYQRLHFAKAIFSGVRMWVILMVITQIIGMFLWEFLSLLLPFDSLQEQAITHEFLDSDLAFGTSVVVFMPFVEEIFFRGFLQTFLKNKIGRTKALIYASAVFALVHAEVNLGSLVFIPVLFLFSLGAGFVYEKERNILASITLHILYNATQALLLFIR